MIIENTIHTVLNFLQTCIVYFYLKSLFKERNSTDSIQKISFVLYFALRLSITLWLGVPLAFVLYDLLGILLLSFNYRDQWSKRLFHVCFIYLIFTVSYGLSTLVTPTDNPSIFAPAMAYAIYISIISQLLNIFILLLIRKYKDRVSAVLSLKAAMLYIPPATLFILYLIYKAGNIPLMFKLIGIFLMLVLNFIAFYIFNHPANYVEHEQKSRALKQQTLYYESELALIQKNFKNISVLKHDLQNHLSVIFGLIKQNKNEECIQYLEEINAFLTVERAIANSGNVIIDSIINYKLYQLERNKTRVTVSLKIPSDIDIPSFDIATILGNLLDNAIEGTMTVSSDRFISINIILNKGMLSIRVQNSFDGIIKKDGGEILSRKRGFETKGTGMERVLQVVNMNKGLLEYNIEDHIFTAKVLLYIS
ncbi:MAG: sensor histidine kinase [Candidatus Fimivivens sp.]